MRTSRSLTVLTGNVMKSSLHLLAHTFPLASPPPLQLCLAPRAEICFPTELNGNDKYSSLRKIKDNFGY